MKQRNILCVSNPSWSGDYAKAIVEMMRVFVRHGNKVLYVENPFTWMDIFRLVIKGKIGEAISQLISSSKAKSIRIEHQHVLVLNPGPVIPINFLSSGKWYDRFQAFNAKKIRKKVRHILEAEDMQEDLIHINAFNPLVAKGTAGEFGEKTLIYYCYDEIRAAAYLKHHGPDLEQWLMKRADFTVVSSEGLLENKGTSTKSIHLVKNGVDYNLFKQGYRSTAPDKPRIGYIGSIDDRLDLELLEKLFKAFPDFEFEFVGRCNHPEVKAFLSDHPQVILAGAHRYTELHVFLSRYTLGIIPFVKNEFTAGIYPLKINEYLAAGIPVVTTHFSQLDDFTAVASICDDHASFIDAIKSSIKTDNPDLRQQRQAFASQNSWENRAGLLADIISKYEHE